MEEDDQVQIEPRGLNMVKSLSKYQRIVCLLETLGCQYHSEDGIECECFQYLKSFGHHGIFDALTSPNKHSSPTSVYDFTDDEDQFEKQFNFLKRIKCRRCNHTAGK